MTYIPIPTGHICRLMFPFVFLLFSSNQCLSFMRAVSWSPPQQYLRNWVPQGPKPWPILAPQGDPIYQNIAVGGGSMKQLS